MSAAALSVSGLGALTPALSVMSGSASGPALSVSGPGSLSLSPAAPCVGPPPLSRSLCRPRTLWLSVSGPRRAGHVYPHVTHPVCGPPTQICVSPIWSAGSSDPRAAHSVRDPNSDRAPSDPHLRSACHLSGPVPPIQPGAFPFSKSEPQTLNTSRTLRRTSARLPRGGD